MSTQCTSFLDFLFSLSPAVAGLLSAIALWVASRARSTSKDAQQTSQVLLDHYATPSPGHSVVVPPELVAALRKR